MAQTSSQSMWWQAEVTTQFGQYTDSYHEIPTWKIRTFELFSFWRKIDYCGATRFLNVNQCSELFK